MKLTDKQIKEIRDRLYNNRISFTDLAGEMGVTKGYISNILNRDIANYVSDEMLLKIDKAIIKLSE